jgi:hypothetical protein
LKEERERVLEFAFLLRTNSSLKCVVKVNATGYYST